MPYEITINFNSQPYFGQYLYDSFPSLWPNYASFSDYLPLSPSCLEQRTKISENHIKKNTPLKRISLLYPRISPTTNNEFYVLEISTISNYLYRF